MSKEQICEFVCQCQPKDLIFCIFTPQTKCRKYKILQNEQFRFYGRGKNVREKDLNITIDDTKRIKKGY